MRMNGKNVSARKFSLRCATMLTVLAAAVAANAQVQPYKTIYKYNGASTSGLILDSAGNLYGVDEGGKTGDCSFGCGTVFELSPQTGGWKRTTLYEFHGSDDGKNPGGALAFDPAGNYTALRARAALMGVEWSLSCPRPRAADGPSPCSMPSREEQMDRRRSTV